MNKLVLLLVLTCSGSYTLEKREKSELIHRLRKRQAAEELGPVPFRAAGSHGPLPYQQQQADSSSDSSNSSAAAESDASSNAGDIDARANHDYQSSRRFRARVDSRRAEDWASSGNPGQGPSPSIRGSPQVQDRRSHQYNGGASISDRSSGDPSSGRGRRPYYQHQPPISSGHRQPSHGQFHLSGQAQGQVPTQSHMAGVTRYTFAQPAASRASRRGSSSSRTYTYPFYGGRNVGYNPVAVQGAAVGGEGGEGGDEVEGLSRVRNPVGGASQASVIEDEEPVVQVFPSERPVVNPQASQQQLLRQREQERQRRLQLRRQHQLAAGNAQRRPSAGQQLRPIYSGSQAGVGSSGGSYGQPSYYGGQQQPYWQQQQYGGVQPSYNSQGQPVYSQGQPGGRFQQPSFGYGQGGVNQNGDYDSECPNTGIRIQINGIPCEQAVDHYGSYLCYRHEYTSRECCRKCHGMKNSARIGCEYGDHSGRCQQLQPHDCYDLRNRQSCCHSCERMQIPGARSACEYGDMIPNCERVRQNPGLCYIPENRYLCCQTCSTIRVTDDPECPWGDQNADLCQPFDRSGNIRINCYAPPIKRICCQACRRLEEWIPVNQPGCEYGDRPVTFNTGMHRNLNCTSFMRYYGYDQCTQNQAVASNCCYTCHRYTQG